VSLCVILLLMRTLLPMGDEFRMNFEAVCVSFSAFLLFLETFASLEQISQRRGLLRQWVS
jgi:hypothetical protein